MLLRFLVLVGYIAAFVALHAYLRDHPPRFKGNFVQPLMCLLWALLRMWGPLLWFLPGLLWIGMAPIPAWMVIIFSFLIPFNIFLGFLWAAGVFPSFSTSPRDALLVRLVWGMCLFVFLATALAMVGTLLNTLPSSSEMLKLALFFVFVTFPSTLAVIMLVSGVVEIIPIAPDESQRVRRMLELFTGFFTTFPKPSWIVEDGVVKTQIKGSPFYGVGPGWIMTEPENVVIFKDGSSVKRIVGPGVTFTESRESPHEVIDLRNQFRVTRTTAITRDGIEISLPISSLFRIYPGKNQKIDLKSLERQEPWPYHTKRDIYQIVFAEEVDPTGKTPLEARQARPWDDIPLKVALNQLKQVIPEYRLDDIYSIDAQSHALTRLAIATRVRDVVRQTVVPLGFEILGGGVGNKVTPVSEDVTKQRVEAWKARWINRVFDLQAKVETERFTRFARIRARARVNLFAKIVNLIEPTQENRDDFAAYYLVESLLYMAKDPRVQDMLPQSAMPTLARLQQLTKEG